MTGRHDSDRASANPFASVAISDANAGQTETVTVTLGPGGDGILTDPATASDGGTFGAGGVFSIAGSAAQVTAILQALTFVPKPHQVAPGASVTTSFAIAVTDTAGQSASDDGTSVIATAADDAPVIGGTMAGQTITNVQTLQPFAQATITDPDFGAMVTAAIVCRPGAMFVRISRPCQRPGTGASCRAAGPWQVRTPCAMRQGSRVRLQDLSKVGRPACRVYRSRRVGWGMMRQRSMSRAAKHQLSIRIDLASGGRIGPGKVALLEAIGQTGSISAAGRAMKMSYRRAWQLVEDLNRNLGNPVVETAAGGAGGGGARLTEAGRTLVQQYRAVEQVASDTARRHLKALDGVVLRRPPKEPSA